MDCFNLFLTGFAGTTAVNEVYDMFTGWGATTPPKLG
jgi:hypothetical protein